MPCKVRWLLSGFPAEARCSIWSHFIHTAPDPVVAFLLASRGGICDHCHHSALISFNPPSFTSSSKTQPVFSVLGRQSYSLSYFYPLWLHKKGPRAWNISYLETKSPQGLLPWGGVSFPLPGSMYIRVCVNGSRARPQLSELQTPGGGLGVLPPLHKAGGVQSHCLCLLHTGPTGHGDPCLVWGWRLCSLSPWAVSTHWTPWTCCAGFLSNLELGTGFFQWHLAAF